MKAVGRILKFYSRVIAECIPLFVTAGLLSALSVGALEHTYLHEISNILSFLVIPVFMGYKAGNMCGGDVGGLAGTLAASAVVMTEPAAAMVLSVIAGSIAGFFCRKGTELIKQRIPVGFEMLFGNLYLAVMGLLTGFLTYVLLIPGAAWLTTVLGKGLSDMLAGGVIPFISFLVEPLKILFFNNWLNHGFFLPLGLEQIKAGGSSILFLLETNPGPGLGILLAYTLVYRNMRKQMISSLIIHTLGGIHEVYFPYILSDIRLLAAAIAGGITGNYCFMVTGSGLLGPASPGSVITLLIMADKERLLGVLMGIVVSAVVTCLLASLILAGKKKKGSEDVKTIPKQAKLYFVCDVGMGSSAMAGALFRRQLKAEGITGIEVFHVSADRIPEDADAIICQVDFARSLPPLNKRCFTVENLTNMSSYQEILEWLRGGG